MQLPPETGGHLTTPFRPDPDHLGDLVEKLIARLPPSGDDWVFGRGDDLRYGTLAVCRARPARVLHVVGVGALAECLRVLVDDGGLAGWSLHPVPPGRTPVVSLSEPLLTASGTRRIFNALDRLPFATVEEIAATPDANLRELMNIGTTSLPAIRWAVAQVLPQLEKEGKKGDGGDQSGPASPGAVLVDLGDQAPSFLQACAKSGRDSGEVIRNLVAAWLRSCDL